MKPIKGQADETPDTGTGHGAELTDASLSAELAAVATAAEGAPMALPNNVIAALFESIHFSPAESNRAYPPNADGSVSKKIASIALVYRGGNAAAAGNVYARGKRGVKKVVVECTFAGTRGQSSMKPLTEQGKADATAFRLWMAEQYVKWRAAGGSQSASSRTTVSLPGADDMFDDIDDEPTPAKK